MLDPHGAVGYRALEDYLDREGGYGIVLETAHPVKFGSVKEILGTYGEIPASITQLLEREKKSIEMGVDYEDLKSIILSRI